MDVMELVEQINDAASAYQIGGLQQFRAQVHRKRPGTSKIFTRQTTFSVEGKNYAFHHGGRTELQFNVGIEEDKKQRFWRHGVAFSFEQGINLRDPELLRPKVDLFNSWIRNNAALLDGFKMWHWKGNDRSSEMLPREIADELLARNVFVFLGARVLEANIDVNRILIDFDRLYPLYQFVEAGTVSPMA